MKSHQEFFAELKRRKVFRVAGIYGIVSFGVLQAADLMLPRLGLPDWTVTFMVALVVLAFPVALILAWAFEVTPDGVKRTDEAAPGEIANIISAPASARWPAGLLALAGVAALVLGAWWVGRQTAPGENDSLDSAAAAAPRLAYLDLADDERPSIAVLPFADMSRDGDQEYFSDGMTEEILNVLAKIQDLRVAARTSTFALRDRELTAMQWGDTLQVRYLVEGSVRKSGDQVRITAQLIDTTDGSHMWTDAYTRPLMDVFQVQAEIAEAIAGALRVPLGLDDPSALVQPVSDMEAYDLYLAGRGRMRERGAALTEAVRLFEAAIDRDSTWAPAWAGLAEATEIRLWHEENFDGQVPDTTQIEVGLEMAEFAARQALILDPDNASAHVALGSVLRDRFEWAEAEQTYRRALALDSDNAEARHQYAELLMAVGRIDEAVVEARRAAALDPAPVRLNVLGSLLMLDGQPVESERVWRRSKNYPGSPGGGSTVNGLAVLLYEQGRFEEAGQAMADVAAVPPDVFDRNWAEFSSWIQSGDLQGIPDSVRQSLGAADFMLLEEPDSAAVALFADNVGLEIRRLYRLWSPLFDPIREHPRVRTYMDWAGLGDAVPQRTAAP